MTQYIFIFLDGLSAQRLGLSSTNGLQVGSAIRVLLAMHNDGTLRYIAPTCRQVHSVQRPCTEKRSNQRYYLARFAHLLSPKQKHTGFPTTIFIKFATYHFRIHLIPNGGIVILFWRGTI